MLEIRHPNVNISLSQGFTAPIYHPNVQSLLVTETGTFNNTVNHPDVDELIKSGTPLPRSHPGLEQYITYKSFDFTYKRLTIKPYWHPSIDELWRSKTSAPENHPNINQYFSNDVPLSHPNIDDIIRNPAFYNMPPYHPPIDPFVGFNSTRPISTVNLPFWHASIDQLVSSNTALPKYHPLVDQMFRNMDAFPNGHVNIDLILANPQNYEMPNYHPLIDLNVQISARPNLTDNSLPTEILVTVPYWHPNPDNMFWAMYSTPKNHPKVHSYFSANAAFPPTHPNVDEIIASPSKYTIPKGHPKINSWINTQVSPVFEEVTRVYSKLHPNIDISLASGRNVPLDHPKVAKYFSKYLPPSHPDIDEILASPSLHPFPSHWHPSINVFVGSMNPPQSVIVQKLPKWHPPVNESLSTGIAASPNHLTINDRFVGLLPDNHPDIDYIIANPTKFKIPSFHPPLSDYISYELSTSNSPLAILPIGVKFRLILSILIFKKYLKKVRLFLKGISQSMNFSLQFFRKTTKVLIK